MLACMLAGSLHRAVLCMPARVVNRLTTPFNSFTAKRQTAWVCDAASLLSKGFSSRLTLARSHDGDGECQPRLALLQRAPRSVAAGAYTP